MESQPMRTPFTTLPFIVAMLIGIASMGLSVYDIHSRELGTLNVGHLQASPAAVAAVRAAAHPLLARLRLVFGDERGEVAAELLVPVSGIKAVLQRGADIVKAMQDARVKIADPKTTADDRTTARADFKA